MLFLFLIIGGRGWGYLFIDVFEFFVVLVILDEILFIFGTKLAVGWYKHLYLSFDFLKKQVRRGKHFILTDENPRQELWGFIIFADNFDDGIVWRQSGFIWFDDRELCVLTAHGFFVVFVDHMRID